MQSFTSAPAGRGWCRIGDDGYAEQGGEASSGGGGPRIGGRVETREDVVIKALDAIADYYRRKEPTSPVPTVLQRAREWVNLDFLTILEDIAPGALDEARKRVLVSQRKPSEGDGYGW